MTIAQIVHDNEVRSGVYMQTNVNANARLLTMIQKHFGYTDEDIQNKVRIKRKHMKLVMNLTIVLVFIFS